MKNARIWSTKLLHIKVMKNAKRTGNTDDNRKKYGKIESARDGTGNTDDNCTITDKIESFKGTTNNADERKTMEK